MRSVCSCAVLSAFLLVGCGGGTNVPVVKARGKVTQGGLPLDSATLIFAPTDGGKLVGTALSSSDGTFEITMNNQAGALPGNYKVMVTKYIHSAPRLEPGEHAETPGSSKLLTPERYSKLESTDLMVTVPPEGSDQLEVKLP